MHLCVHPAVNSQTTNVQLLVTMNASMHMTKHPVPPSAQHVPLLARLILLAVCATTELNLRLLRVLLMLIETRVVARTHVTGQPSVAEILDSLKEDA